MAITTKCGSCCFRDQTGTCAIFKTPIETTRISCPAYKSQLFTCTNCGGAAYPSVTWAQNDNGDWNALCDNCAANIGSCPTCANAAYCAFESDPVALPKMVVKIIRQGNTQIQTQIPNPERVDKTCREKCKCFDPENGCQRQSHFCGNWRSKV